MKPQLMKSMVQSYDVKDNEEFEGVMELEAVLNETEDADIDAFHAAVVDRFQIVKEKQNIARKLQIEIKRR